MIKTNLNNFLGLTANKNINEVKNLDIVQPTSDITKKSINPSIRNRITVIACRRIANVLWHYNLAYVSQNYKKLQNQDGAEPCHLAGDGQCRTDA